MTRLFRKFFVFFWLAQFLTATLVGGLIWLGQDGKPPRHLPPSTHEMPRPPHANMTEPPPPPHLGPPRVHLPIIPIVVGSVVSLIFAYLLARYFSQPIEGLRSAMGRLTTGQLDARTNDQLKQRNDELADLGKDFDHMAQRLEDMVMDQRRLLHDVSHELRSPLARIQAATDLLQQQPERQATFIGQIEKDIVRMDDLIEQLLSLSRLENQMSQLNECIGVIELAENIIADANFEAGQPRCRLTLRTSTPPTVHGNPELLYRALENIVRNALHHTPADSPIEIDISCPHPDIVSISISDHGPGIPAVDLENAFQPFYRIDRGPDAHPPKGYGLGLAMTQRIITVHQGKIHASNRPEGGLRVEISLATVNSRE